MYIYKLQSLEVYKSRSPIPQIAADVMAFTEEGAMVAHKTVILDAGNLDKQIVDKDTAKQASDKVVALVLASDPSLNSEELDKVIAEKAKEDAELAALGIVWAEADVVLKKTQSKLESKLEAKG